MSDPVVPVDSLGALYREHHRWLNTWLRRKLQCSESAADLAQDTFVRLLQKRNRESLREPRAYLVTIAKGLVVNLRRRQALEQAYLETLAAMPEAESPSPEMRLLILDALLQIDRLLGGLPAQVRGAFLMSQLDGLTYAQIATQLGICERTVKRHMVRAFAQCLAALA